MGGIRVGLLRLLEDSNDVRLQRRQLFGDFQIWNVFEETDPSLRRSGVTPAGFVDGENGSEEPEAAPFTIPPQMCRLLSRRN